MITVSANVRVAVILRGPPGGGKTTVARTLMSELGDGASLANLDDGWAKGESRHPRKSDSYDDLKSTGSVIVIELGYGEPGDSTSTGATMAPWEWVDVLRSEGRNCYFFLLTASKQTCIERDAERGCKSVDPIGSCWERYRAGGDCCWLSFSRRLRYRSYAETELNTEYCDLSGTIKAIVGAVAEFSMVRQLAEEPREVG